MEGSRVAVLVFKTPTAAKKVLKKLDQHVIHGSKLVVRPLSVADEPNPNSSAANPEPAPRVEAPDVEAIRGRAKRTSRVIVRNLSFKATDADLKVGSLFTGRSHRRRS